MHTSYVENVCGSFNLYKYHDVEIRALKIVVIKLFSSLNDIPIPENFRIEIWPKSLSSISEQDNLNPIIESCCFFLFQRLPGQFSPCSKHSAFQSSFHAPHIDSKSDTAF